MIESPEGKKLLQTLENSLSPFEKFVAKADIEEILPVVSSRKIVFNNIIKILNSNNEQRIIPLYAATGMGKTYFLWQVKKSLKLQAHAVFIEIPSNPKNFYYEIYTSIIEEIGINTLREITAKIADDWGANEKKYGLFRTSNSQKILENAKMSQIYQDSQQKQNLEICMKAIITHTLDPEKTSVAERWLLGEIMDNDELFYLNIEKNLSGEYIARELLILILNYLQEGIIIMFDDLDKNWTRYSIYNEFEDDDEDWGSISENLNLNASLENQDNTSLEDITLFEQIEKMTMQNHNLYLIFTAQKEEIEQILLKFSESGKNLIHTPMEIQNYTITDTIDYYLEAMKLYRRKYNLQAVPNNSFFPLTKKLILMVFEFTKGNPREIIRAFQKLFDALIFEEWTIRDLQQNYMQLLLK